MTQAIKIKKYYRCAECNRIRRIQHTNDHICERCQQKQKVIVIRALDFVPEHYFRKEKIKTEGWQSVAIKEVINEKHKLLIRR
jgi:hypothetical protein